MRPLKQFLALTGLTVLETARQPFFLLLAGSCVVLTGLVPVLTMHNFGEEGKLARDSGLAFHLVLGLFLTAHAASTALTREVRDGTAGTILSKPVGRGLLFFSKFAALSVVIAVFSSNASIAVLLAERAAERHVMNAALVGYVLDWRAAVLLLAAPFAAFAVAGLLDYLKKRPFGSSAFLLLPACLILALLASGFVDRTGEIAPYSLQVRWNLLPANALVTLGLLLAAAIALFVSTMLGNVAAMVVCVAVFFVGLSSDFLLGRFADRLLPAAFLYGLVPNWQHFWVCDGLSGGGHVPWTYVLNAAGYAVAWSAGVLGLGSLAFRRADLA